MRDSNLLSPHLSGDLASKALTTDADAQAAPATGRPEPGETPRDVANAEAWEIASDEAFDRTLNILGPARLAGRASNSLRRRGRHREHQ